MIGLAVKRKSVLMRYEILKICITPIASKAFDCSKGAP